MNVSLYHRLTICASMSYALDNPRFFTILPNGTLYELLFELMQTSNNKGETSEESWIRVKTKKKLKIAKIQT